MAVELPRKIQLVMRVAGCATQKELHARLKAVNPRTGYHPTRAYKWMQGRAQPRDPAVYEDLARLFRLPIGGEVLRDCTYEEFQKLVRETQQGRALFRADAVHVSRHAVDASAPGYLVGSFVALSRAWSTARPHDLVFATMAIDQDPVTGLTAVYREVLAGGDLELEGSLRQVGSCLHASLVSMDGQTLVTLTLSTPPSPGAVFGGVMSGAAFHDLQARPSTCRVLILRTSGAVPQTDGLTCYVPKTVEKVAGRLVDHGFAVSLADRLAASALDFLLAPATSGLVVARMDELSPMVGTILGGVG